MIFSLMLNTLMVIIAKKSGCTHYHKITRHRVVQCKECGHQQYLFANTIFQDNKQILNDSRR